MTDNVSAFSSGEYDGKIDSVLPYYSEFGRQIYDLIDALDIKNFKWLDTGCGTGNLVFSAAEKFPDCEFVLCDPSEKMLESARRKLEKIKNVRFRNIPSQSLDYECQFDIVTSVQSHHYLDREQRRLAEKNCFNALKNGGVYITFENIALNADEVGMKRWKNYMINQGKTEQEIHNHMLRRGTQVFPITIQEHFELLYKTGFKTVDMLWMSYMQAGFFAVK